MSEEDDEHEWKSSHERFVDALAKFTALQEELMQKQDRVANGFYLEVTRKELLAHLEDRAEHYLITADIVGEKGLEIPENWPRLSDGSPMLDPQHVEALEKDHARKIENMRAKSKTFAFAAKHLPEGKEIFCLSLEGAAALEFVPAEKHFGLVGR